MHTFLLSICIFKATSIYNSCFTLYTSLEINFHISVILNWVVFCWVYRKAYIDWYPQINFKTAYPMAWRM